MVEKGNVWKVKKYLLCPFQGMSVNEVRVHHAV